LPCVAQASFTVDSVSTTGKLYVTNKSTGAKTYYWSFGDSTFSKDKTPGKSYTSSGTYNVCLVAYDSLNKCSTVYCTTVKVVKGRNQASVSPLNPSNNFTSYPNPSDNGFWVETNSTDIQYRIINVNGSILQSGRLNQPKLWISSKDWANGLYFIQLEEKSGLINQQSIVVQHP
jgi:PKD repeat protein